MRVVVSLSRIHRVYNNLRSLSLCKNSRGYYIMDNLSEGMLIGIGNPLLDISATVGADLLAKYGLKDNDAIMAEEKHMPLYKELVEKYNAEYIAGGSVQNSLRVAQWLVRRPRVAAYFGCIGNDEFGEVLRNKAIADGVNVQYQRTDAQPTGTCAVLITGTHRSLCANLAAANCFTVDHLTDNDEAKRLVQNARFFYVSGFFLAVSPPSVMLLAKQALKHGNTMVMNLSAPFVSQVYRKPLEDVLPYVDILFGNETEAETFAKEFNFENPTDIKAVALKICKMPKQNENRPRVVVITQGALPVILAQEGEITEVEVTRIPQEQIVDTNGAGDAFAGGFLAQLIQEKPLKKCVECGIYTASKIIQQSGCTFSGIHNFEC